MYVLQEKYVRICYYVILSFQTLRAKAALTMFECCGKFDPNTSSSYLALYQVNYNNCVIYSLQPRLHVTL